MISNCKFQISNSQGGYIALMSAIVISVLLLAITVSMGFSGFLGRFNILDSQSKERSSALAEACVDIALVRLAQNISYNPVNEAVAVSGDRCNVISVVTSGAQKIIQTKAVINKSHTNLKVIVSATTLAVVSWDECATGPCP